ncbi:DUF1707 domain-containing protein [Spirillospora sp. NPDC050365]
MQRLRDAYATGHLTREEMDERLDQVLTARTHGDLATPWPRSRTRTRAPRPRSARPPDGSSVAAPGASRAPSRSSPPSARCAWTCPRRSSSTR